MPCPGAGAQLGKKRGRGGEKFQSWHRTLLVPLCHHPFLSSPLLFPAPFPLHLSFPCSYLFLIATHIPSQHACGCAILSPSIFWLFKGHDKGKLWPFLDKLFLMSFFLTKKTTTIPLPSPLFLLSCALPRGWGTTWQEEGEGMGESFRVGTGLC